MIPMCASERDEVARVAELVDAGRISEEEGERRLVIIHQVFHQARRQAP